MKLIVSGIIGMTCNSSKTDAKKWEKDYSKHYTNKNTFTYHINGNKKPVRMDEVEPHLQELLQNSEDPTFSIYADKTVPIEQVVNMMNIGKRNKYKVILATSPE